MRKTLSLVALLAALALLATACGGSDDAKSEKPTVPAGAVAVVGDETITQEQFDALYTSAVKQGTANGQTAPKKGSAEEKTLQQQVLQSLVQNAEIEQGPSPRASRSTTPSSRRTSRRSRPSAARTSRRPTTSTSRSRASPRSSCSSSSPSASRRSRSTTASPRTSR
jgi:hypothetical protein